MLLLVQLCNYLQTSATMLTHHDPAMQYSAEVGVNSYVRIMLSFLHKQVSCLYLFTFTETFTGNALLCPCTREVMNVYQ